MSFDTVNQSKDSITYFQPLKEDSNALNSSSGVLQFVYKLFSSKRGQEQSSPSNKESSKKRKTSNDRAAPSRPNVLDLPVQKPHEPGSEVELRLRSLSTLLKDIPKFMKPGQTNEQSDGSELSSNPNSSELKQYWMPDSQCHECYDCGERFTTFRRRHHCRICGQIFCSRCCNQLISGKIMDYPGMLRSCTYCCKLVLTFAQGNESKADLARTSNLGQPVSPMTDSTLEEPGREISMSDSSHSMNGYASGMSVLHLKSNNLRRSSQNSGKYLHESKASDDPYFGTGLPTPLHPSLMMSPGHDILKASKYIFDAAPNIVTPAPTTDREHFDLIRDSSQLHLLWRKINDEKDGIEFRDHRFRLRKYSMCITGQELVDWLIRNDVTSTRAQACAIGQALYEGKWLKPVTDIDGVFQDGYVLFQRSTNINSSGLKIEIFPDHFAEKNPETGDNDTIFTLTDQEPIWVQEIKCDNGDSEDEEFYDSVSDSNLLWTHMQFEDSLTYSDDEKSLSEKSFLSLSSFVEIDEQKDMIKYTRSASFVGNSIGQTRTVVSPQPTFNDSCLTGISADYLRSFLTWNGTFLNQPWIAPCDGWRESTLQSSSHHSHDKRAYQWLREVYLHHGLSFLKQLLVEKGLDLEWAGVLVPLAKHAAESISPDPNVSMDICHYVQIKKLSDGPRTESRLLSGVVCTKNVVNKMMKTDIAEPDILLLAIPLEYQRVQLKLSALDPIVIQEHEFYKHLVSRITSRKPHVVLVQCTVSHIAQNLLLQAGISLVINVKPSVMERVARCTGADIVCSIDQLLQAKLGHCSRFYVKRHAVQADLCYRSGDKTCASETKTLMYFDGCNPVNGCTIILRGVSNRKAMQRRVDHTGSLVQGILRFFMQAVYHGRLEISYLLDQQEFGKLLKTKSFRKPESKQKHLSSSRISMHDEKASILTDGSADNSENSFSNNRSVESHSAVDVSCKHDHFEASSDLRSDDRQDALPSAGSAVTGNVAATRRVDTENEKPDVGNHLSPDSIEFENTLASTLLSISPLVCPSMPFLLTGDGLISPMHKYLPDKLFWSRIFDKKLSSDENSGGAEYDNEVFGHRSRSSTMESVVQEKMWLTPQHHAHRVIMTAGSGEQDESTLSVEAVGNSVNSKDPQDDGISTPINTRKMEHTSYYSQHYKFHSREISLGSVESMHVISHLTSWEQSIMDQIFRTRTNSECSKSPLSASPIVLIHSPVKDRCHLVKQSTPPSWQVVRTATLISAGDVHDFVARPLTQPASSTVVKDLLASFRAHAGLGEDTPTPVHVSNASNGGQKSNQKSSSGTFHALDCMDPSYHQHINVLFSSYSAQSPNAPDACVLPWVVDIDFYKENDITLGGFLERYCFRPSYHCPNVTCRRPMIEHVRSFVRGNMCLNIVLKELSKPFLQSSILTWNWNQDTMKSSEIKTLSHDAWSMSFAKYLELRLEGVSIPASNFSSSPDHRNVFLTRDAELEAFTSFQYFLHGDIVAAFKCFPVDISEVIFPPSVLLHRQQLTFHTCELSEDCAEQNVTLSHYSKSMKILSEKLYEVLETIYDCINTARDNGPAASSSPDESVQTRESYFKGLLDLHHNEKIQLREEVDSLQLRLQAVHLSTAAHDHQLAEPDDAVEADEFEDLISIADKNNVPLSEEVAQDLSYRVLKLKCEISGVVQSWNQKFEEISFKERNQGWNSKALRSVGNSPMLSRKQNVPAPIQEEISVGQKQSDDNVFTIGSTPVTSGSNDMTSCQHNGVKAPCDQILQAQSGEQEAVGISRQTTSLRPNKSERSFEKHHSSKRLSRTGSSVRSLVTRLLPGNTLIPAVPSPFSLEEHYLLPECLSTKIVVRDSEPTSIIAYALSTSEYRNITSSNAVANQGVAHEEDGGSSTPVSSSPTAGSSKKSSPKFPDLKETNEGESFSIESVPKTPTTLPHFELQFSDTTAKFYCKVYFASLFTKLRSKILEGGEAQYLSSMSRSVRWVARGGKSGSTFHKTRDDQFIMKQMSNLEMHSFLEFAPKYVDYVTNSIDSQATSTLSKILGVYRISFRNSETNKSIKQDVLIIENLFYQKNIKQIFDLKGSVRNRHVKPDSSASATSEGCSADHHSTVLLDENLIKIMCDEPLCIHEHTKHLLTSAILRDARFLASQLIMDYSLLAGVDEDNKIVVGIIDYIRTFTWDKKLEMVVKSYGMIGGRRQGNRSMPTVVSPELYKNRFCEAMDRYFLVVPDRWYGMHAY